MPYIPIPIYTGSHSNGGPMDQKDLIAFIIFFIALWLVFAIIRSIVWVVKRRDRDYYMDYIFGNVFSVLVAFSVLFLLFILLVFITVPLIKTLL
jgi:hypothetical protein